MNTQTITTPLVYPAIGKVAAALAKNGIGKDKQNPQQGFKFRGIDDVYAALSPALIDAKLLFTPRCLKREVIQYTTKSGSQMFNVTVEVEFDLISTEDASKHVVRTFGEAMDTADKATNKAMSAAYKYAAFLTFCIPTEGQEDADGHTPESIAPRAPSAPTR